MKTVFVRGPLNSNFRLKEFQKRIEDKYNVHFETYWDLHRWTVDNNQEFWDETWKFLDIICSKPYTTVMEPNKKFEDVPHWFLGARLNYAENILRCADEDVALVLGGEERTTVEKVTFGQLKKEVSLLSSALRKVGVKSGDVVVCYVSNRKEAMVAVLAAAAIGALFSAVNPVMGVQAVVSRFAQLNPKVLFTIDRHMYCKEERNVLKILPEMIQELPTLEHVIIVPSNEASLQRDISGIRNSVFLPDFLRKGLQRDGRIPTPYYEQLPYNHPLLINYTSGTTGQPKGIVHSAGAALVTTLMEMAFMMNAQKTDLLLTIYSPGWVSWNIFMSALALGAPLLIYEGGLIDECGKYFWDFLEENKVTVVFIPPYNLQIMEKNPENLPGPEHKLESLHTIVSGSSYVKPCSYDFVHKSIKRDVFFSAMYGSTEIASMACGTNHNLPVHREEMQVPCLGMDVCCYNEEGERVLDQKGELVIAKPFPSMPLFLWNDENKQKYKSSFFDKFPDVWCQNDICAINSRTGGILVYGRSDETINQKGERFGSSEIYAVVNVMKEIDDSLCVSRWNKEVEEEAILFVKMRKGMKFTPEFEASLKLRIEKELSEYHVPEYIFEVKDIPYNINSKRTEVLVKKILMKSRKISTDAVLNAECLQEYFKISETLNK